MQSGISEHVADDIVEGGRYRSTSHTVESGVVVFETPI